MKMNRPVRVCDLLQSVFQFDLLKLSPVREISSELCDHREGWGREGGREMQEGGDMGI